MEAVFWSSVFRMFVCFNIHSYFICLFIYFAVHLLFYNGSTLFFFQNIFNTCPSQDLLQSPIHHNLLVLPWRSLHVLYYTVLTFACLCDTVTLAESDNRILSPYFMNKWNEEEMRCLLLMCFFSLLLLLLFVLFSSKKIVAGKGYVLDVFSFSEYISFFFWSTFPWLFFYIYFFYKLDVFFSCKGFFLA